MYDSDIWLLFNCFKPCDFVYTCKILSSWRNNFFGCLNFLDVRGTHHLFHRRIPTSLLWTYRRERVFIWQVSFLIVSLIYSKLEFCNAMLYIQCSQTTFKLCDNFDSYDSHCWLTMIFRKKKVNKEVRKMQCDCTYDAGEELFSFSLGILTPIHYKIHRIKNVPSLHSNKH